jgi:small subunit ribosomal protein S17
MAERKKKTERRMGNKEKTKTAGADADESVSREKRIGTRGRTFEGKVIRKFPKRVTIGFERMVYIRKYERYAKFKTKIHARLPESLENDIDIGDLIQVRECRPLSKIIHFIVTKKIRDSEEKQK